MHIFRTYFLGTIFSRSIHSIRNIHYALNPRLYVFPLETSNYFTLPKDIFFECLKLFGGHILI